MKTIESNWTHPLQGKCGCFPPGGIRVGAVLDRTREGEKAICDHGQVWELVDPSSQYRTRLYLVWRKVGGLRAWAVRRKVR